MSGDLVMKCRQPDGTTYRSGRVDAVPFEKMVAAAACGDEEVGLDRESGVVEGRLGGGGGKVGDGTWRSSGMTVSVPIFYENKKTLAESQALKYRYVPSLAGKDVGAKILDIMVNANGSFTYVTKYGVRLVFTQAGSIGQFSLQNLLISIVAGLSLLRLATFTVDVFIIFLAKDRALYRRLKFQQYDVDGESGTAAGIGPGFRFIGGQD
ncbi:hypothetical protein BC829DRAFT_293084 [Chytridium lagenaria]|nr:hypothetical protein BC829DRAFT_293084 [Chytridium lagenaria]